MFVGVLYLLYITILWPMQFSHFTAFIYFLIIILYVLQAWSTRRSRSTRVTLLVETFEVRKHLLTLSLVEMRSNADASLKIHKLFIYGDKQ